VGEMLARPDITLKTLRLMRHGERFLSCTVRWRSMLPGRGAFRLSEGLGRVTVPRQSGQFHHQCAAAMGRHCGMRKGRSKAAPSGYKQTNKRSADTGTARHGRRYHGFTSFNRSTNKQLRYAQPSQFVASCTNRVRHLLRITEPVL